jgi:hypothetical protein
MRFYLKSVLTVLMVGSLAFSESKAPEPDFAAILAEQNRNTICDTTKASCHILKNSIPESYVPTLDENHLELGEDRADKNFNAAYRADLAEKASAQSFTGLVSAYFTLAMSGGALGATAGGPALAAQEIKKLSNELQNRAADGDRFRAAKEKNNQYGTYLRTEEETPLPGNQNSNGSSSDGNSTSPSNSVKSLFSQDQLNQLAKQGPAAQKFKKQIESGKFSSLSALVTELGKIGPGGKLVSSNSDSNGNGSDSNSNSELNGSDSDKSSLDSGNSSGSKEERFASSKEAYQINRVEPTLLTSNSVASKKSKKRGGSEEDEGDISEDPVKAYQHKKLMAQVNSPEGQFFLLQNGITKLKSKTNIFQIAHRNFRSFGNWKKRFPSKPKRVALLRAPARR